MSKQLTEGAIMESIFAIDSKPIEIDPAQITMGDPDVTTAEIIKDTKSHIGDVIAVGKFLTDIFTKQVKAHDTTKLEHPEMYAHDLAKHFQGTDLLGFWEIHRQERHHDTPEDVNLLDILEKIIDGCVAGTARKGDVYPIEIPVDVLLAAVANTQKLIVKNLQRKEDENADEENVEGI
jgi:hypothetical protein